RKKGQLVSAVVKHAAEAGLVQFSNNTDRKITVQIKNCRSLLGSDEPNAAEKSEKFAAWKLLMQPVAQSLVKDGIGAVVTTWLVYEVITSDGKTTHTANYQPAQPPGVFLISIEPKDLHPKNLIKIVHPWNFYQAQRRLKVDQGSSKTESNNH